ncbi:MAG: hypothetical protein LBB75_05320 [Oscillospiraceae bacterium]|jgi:putative flippase GtrA|nr:hypothetical protein [Oscillospiraceae bacterium]
MGNGKEKKGVIARLDDTAFARRHAEAWTFAKFAVVSSLSGLVELLSQLAALAVYRALNITSLPNFFFFRFIEDNTPPQAGYTLAMVVYAFITSTAVGYAVGFVMNRKTAFHSDANIALSAFLTFLLMLFTITANSFIGPAISGYLPKLGFLPQGLVPALSKMLSMTATLVWLYPANRFVIHRKKKGKAP